MRIGEIKNIIKEVLNDSNVIEIKNEAVYGGQAQQINNFKQLSEALDILSKQNWNKEVYSEVEKIIKSYESDSGVVILPIGEYNQLSSYINTINSKIPLYFSIIESISGTQDEKVINIKLPEGLSSLKDLSDLNKRLEDVFKLFNVDGQFEFQGFDRGSEWYILATQGVLSYGFVISCLKIAREYLKTRTEYFKSEEARIAYQASLKTKDEETEEGFSEYQEKRLKIVIEKEVEKTIKELGSNGQTQQELHSQLVKATTKLVKELGAGTEFHLSLNPPAYVKENAGNLKIDYKKIQSLLPKKDERPKQVEAPKIEEVKESSEDSNKK